MKYQANSAGLSPAAAAMTVTEKVPETVKDVLSIGDEPRE